MQSAHRFVAAVWLLLSSASAFASTTVYTSASAFLPLVAPGSYTESFTGLSDTAGLFSGGGFAYSILAPGPLYASGDFIGTNLPDQALTIQFTSGNVTALGGNFFVTNLSDDFQAVAMTLTLSDGSTVSFTPTTQSASYRGFISDIAITSLIIASPGVSLYGDLDNLTVGTRLVTVPAVPEPATWLLMGLGLAGAAVTARRRQS